jgi:TPR repeat protein
MMGRLRLRNFIPFLICLLCATALAGPATQSSAPSKIRDRQFRADLEAFTDEMDRFGDRPSDDAVNRMVNLARQNPGDSELLYWGARGAFRGWIGNEVNGTTLLQKAAGMGYAPAIRDLGFLMCLGTQRITQDRVAGMGMLQQIADMGDARALYFVGFGYLHGWGGAAVNPDKAQECFDQALDKGYFPAALDLAELYTQTGDPTKGEQYYELAAELGDVRAMRILVDPSRSDLITRDPAKVGRYLQRGRFWKDEQLGRMLAANILLGRAALNYDEPLALNILRWSADEGDSRAQTLLARARLQGLWGIERQTDRGIRELQWLASGPDPSGSAAFCLGQALWDGAGVSIDTQRASRLIQESADAGFQPAKQWLLQHTSNSQTTRPSISSTTLPNPKSIAQAAMNSLHDVLLAAATTIDSDEQTGAAQKAALALMPVTDQQLEDDDIFRDWMYLETTPPFKAAIARILARARGLPPDSRAMTEAAISVLRKWSDAATIEEATHWLQSAAEMGDPVAMVRYGSYVLHGQGTLQNTQVGLKWLQRALDRSEPMAYLYLGLAYVEGAPGLEKDMDKGMSLLQESYKKGDLLGIWGLALHYYRQSDWRDLFPLLEEGNAQEYPPASSMFAWLLTGQLPMGDKKVSWNGAWNAVFVRGALCGYAIPATWAAVQLGSENPGDPNLARLLLLRSAQEGCVEAKALVAVALVTGAYGISPDVDRGVNELERLIKLDIHGLTVPFDAIEAGRGRAEAKWRLGQLMYQGKFIQKNQQRGQQLIESAASEGNPDANKWLANQKKK